MRDHPPIRTLEEADEYVTDRYDNITGLISAEIEKQIPRLGRDEKEEYCQDVATLFWSEFSKLAEAGRDVLSLLPKIVYFAVLRLKSERTSTNFHPLREIMSCRCRFREGYAVSVLPQSDRDDVNPELLDAMRDDTSPAEQARVNIDYQAFLETLKPRERRVAKMLYEKGLNTPEIAKKIGKSRGRVQQVVADIREAYEEFMGETQ